MLVMPEAKWEEEEHEEKQQKHFEEYPATEAKQRTLSDFLN